MNPERRGHAFAVAPGLPAGAPIVDLTAERTALAPTLNDARTAYIGAKRQARSFWRNNAVTNFVRRRRGHQTANEQLETTRVEYERHTDRAIALDARTATDTHFQALPTPADNDYQLAFAGNVADAVVTEHTFLQRREIQENREGRFSIRRLRGWMYRNPGLRLAISVGLTATAAGSAAMGAIPITAIAIAARTGWTAMGLEAAGQAGMDTYGNYRGARRQLTRDQIFGTPGGAPAMTLEEVTHRLGSFNENRVLNRLGTANHDTEEWLLERYRNIIRDQVQGEFAAVNLFPWQAPIRQAHALQAEQDAIVIGDENIIRDNANRALDENTAANPDGLVSPVAAGPAPVGAAVTLVEQIINRDGIIAANPFGSPVRVAAEGDRAHFRALLQPMLVLPPAPAAPDANVDAAIIAVINRRQAEARIARHAAIPGEINNNFQYAADAAEAATDILLSTPAAAVAPFVLGARRRQGVLRQVDTLNAEKEQSLNWQRRMRRNRWLVAGAIASAAIVGGELIDSAHISIDNPFTDHDHWIFGNGYFHTPVHHIAPAPVHHTVPSLHQISPDVQAERSLTTAVNNLSTNIHHIFNGPSQLPNIGAGHSFVHTFQPGENYWEVAQGYGLNPLQSLPTYIHQNANILSQYAAAHGAWGEVAAIHQEVATNTLNPNVLNHAAWWVYPDETTIFSADA